MEYKMNMLDKIGFLLVVVGALNWGLVALNFNLVEAILPMGLAKVVYGLVGLSSLNAAVKMIKHKKITK